MAQKHLKELLKEDQEPFHLKDYIAERQRQCQQLKKQPQRTQIQLKKPKLVSKSNPFSCKNACFFSLQDSPDLRKSPLFEFASKSPNRVFLHVPAKTASLLLEAAVRIQTPKTQTKNSGFGLFGSMLKRLTHRSRANKLKDGQTGEKKTAENRGSVVLVGVNEKEASVRVAPCSSCSSSTCNGRQSSLDLESSSSGRSFEEDEDENDDGFEFSNVVRENGGVCLSPLSPFRFALHRSPSPDRRSPFSSPVRRKTEDNMNYEQQNSVKLEEEEDEEDKEQNSPVSVLDAPFEDDYYDGHEYEDSYGLECSYAFVQRAKQQLLHKLRRFEKLAELDPIELEKILIEEDEQLVTNGGQEHEQEYDCDSCVVMEQRQVDELIDNIARKTGFPDIKKPRFRRLVSDLIMEEESAQGDSEDSDEQLIISVCKRLESWKEVESNTIEMMVGMDLMRETLDWKNPREQIGEAAIDVEVGIFAMLVRELVEDMSDY